MIKGYLSVENGGLLHIQNIISTFGGTLSVVTWNSEANKQDMAFMQSWAHIVDIGISLSITIKLTPEQAQNQIRSWGGHDFVKLKKCNMTLFNNSYFALPNRDKYEAEKKSMVN